MLVANTCRRPRKPKEKPTPKEHEKEEETAKPTETPVEVVAKAHQPPPAESNGIVPQQTVNPAPSYTAPAATEWAGDYPLTDPAALVDSNSYYYGNATYWQTDPSYSAVQQSYYGEAQSYDSTSYATQSNYYDGAQSFDASGYNYGYGAQSYGGYSYEAAAQSNYDASGYGYGTEAQSYDASAYGYDTQTYEAAPEAYPAAVDAAPGWDAYYGDYSYQEDSSAAAAWDGYSYASSAYQQAEAIGYSQQDGYSTDQEPDTAESQWEEVFDPQSNQTYYVNRVTQETAWELST